MCRCIQTLLYIIYLYFNNAYNRISLKLFQSSQEFFFSPLAFSLSSNFVVLKKQTPISLFFSSWHLCPFSTAPCPASHQGLIYYPGVYNNSRSYTHVWRSGWRQHREEATFDICCPEFQCPHSIYYFLLPSIYLKIAVRTHSFKSVPSS